MRLGDLGVRRDSSSSAMMASAMACNFANMMVLLKARCGAGGFEPSPKSQRAGAIVGRMKEIIEFAEHRLAGMPLDHAPPQELGAGVAQGAEDAVERRGLVDARGEPKLDRVEGDRVVAFQIRLAIYEPAERGVGRRCFVSSKRAAVTASVAPGSVI